ncbi:hypothetical protein [Parabacteroides provencensis]|uniref:hypothetical protein n=1 Tax=Parabacteroides provencensis TaxID=1944636 RepID=UPI000C157D39|nr:hypothetical protein [Parabacteroides provencensis]
MTTKAYVDRIIDCVESMVKDGVISSAEELQVKYGLPVLNKEVLCNESDESINKIVDALSEKNPGMRVYIQTGARSKIIDNNPVQMGHGNLYGNNSRIKESATEEDCCVKLEKALIKIEYQKRYLDEKDKEIARLNVIISELMKKIK